MFFYSWFTSIKKICKGENDTSQKSDLCMVGKLPLKLFLVKLLFEDVQNYA